MTLIILQWFGCLLGVLGSLLLASNSRVSGWGFVFFLASNFAWILFGIITQTPGLIAMQLSFVIINVYGTYRWLFAKSNHRA
jgi:hypothetical protein